METSYVSREHAFAGQPPQYRQAWSLPRCGLQSLQLRDLLRCEQLARSFFRWALRLAAAWPRTVVFSNLTQYGKPGCLKATSMTRKHCKECGRVKQSVGSYPRLALLLASCFSSSTTQRDACFLHAQHHCIGSVHTWRGVCFCVFELHLSSKQACTTQQSAGLGMCFVKQCLPHLSCGPRPQPLS